MAPFFIILTFKNKEIMYYNRERIFIKGNKERGEEIISLLKNGGGVNIYGESGKDENKYYFLNKENHIVSSDATHLPILEKLMEEYKLPEIRYGQPVMYSHDGLTWVLGMYDSFKRVKQSEDDMSYAATFIVPVNEFDFTDFQSNKQKSLM